MTTVFIWMVMKTLKHSIVTDNLNIKYFYILKILESKMPNFFYFNNAIHSLLAWTMWKEDVRKHSRFWFFNGSSLNCHYSQQQLLPLLCVYITSLGISWFIKLWNKMFLLKMEQNSLIKQVHNFTKLCFMYTVSD